MNKKTVFILVIILLAGFLRFFNLGAADVVHDESINSFRALGYIDFFAEGNGQSTVFNWFNKLPWWTSLSFHDHPPLSFMANFVFLNIFGPNAFAARLASALSGLLSVYLIYLIGKKLYSEKIGFYAALILAVNNFAIFISRIGFQESLLILLILSSVYFFLKALEQKKFFYPSFIFWGLALLTKYTAIFLGPVFFIYLLINNKEIIKEKTLYLASLVSLVIFSPVILYNILLFKSQGHFDLQLSYLFGLTDKVEGWSNLVGKDERGILNRFFDIPTELLLLASPVFLVLVLISLIALIKNYKKNSNLLVILSLVSITLLIGLTGPQERFLILYIPFFALILSYLFLEIIRKKKILAQTFLGLFIIFEVFYSVNTFFIPQALGQSLYAYSDYEKRLRGNWGFNQLDDYLNKELSDKVPAVRFQLTHPDLEEFVSKRYDKKTGQDLAAMVIYDFNLKDGPDIWYIRRRQFYEGWPVITADEFIKETGEKGSDYYHQLGFDTFYFIQATNNSLLRDVKNRSEAGVDLGNALINIGITPIEIKNSQGETSILVYKF